MEISAEAQESIKQETDTFEAVISSLQEQKIRAAERLRNESARARDLTSDLVAARRDEDKAMLASDEAVSHGLKDQKKEELEQLEKQVVKPYFARIVLEEEDSNGNEKIIEYKLGFSANPDCRIIDWRKAPISKLYYEYKEGDEYSEEILGRERIGRVALRNRVEIEKGALVGIANRFGQFVWNATLASWEPVSGSGVRRKSSDSHLPEILSLITAEQFKAITEDADTAILIQGVAGSGKTTVAIHRLAWLLHEDNSALTADECVFIVLSPSLRVYVENSLPSADIKGVNVRTYHEWTGRTLKWIAADPSFTVARPVNPCPHGIERVKRSLAILKALEAYVARQDDRAYRASFQDLQQDLISILSQPQKIIENDETKLIDADLIKQTLERTKVNFKESLFDWSDDALLIRLYQLKVGSVYTEQNKLGKFGHIIVDEVQDFSPVELSTVIGAVKKIKDLTLVGDTSQNIDRSQSFPGWEKLQAHWNFNADMSRYLSLAVSHRSTLPIMQLADAIQGRKTVTTGRAGRVPIWFMCRTESDGIDASLKWLRKATELYPNMLTAVICSDPAEAKFAFKMLQPTFGPLVRLGDQYSFSFEEGILVTDVRQVKGLEFHSVLLWNPSAKNYPATDLGRNLLYVAVTRAEENLSIVSWMKPSPSLPRFGGSKLIRSVDLTIIEEEKDESD